MEREERNGLFDRMNTVGRGPGALRRLFALALCCTLLLGFASARAEDSGVIHVAFSGTSVYDGKEIAIGLYRVGVRDGDTFRMIDKYRTADITLAKTADEINAAIAGAEKIASDPDCDPDYRGVLKDGRLSFTELPAGVYFGRLEEGPVEFGMEPFFALLETELTVNPKWSQVTNAEVDKEWADADNQDGIRPQTVTVRLYCAAGEADFAEYRDEGGFVDRTLSRDNDWRAAAEKLPKFDKDNQEIRYEWRELATPDGYAMDAQSVQDDEGVWHTKVTNTHKPATKSMTILKIWDDSDDQDGKRPESLQATLVNDDGEDVASVVLSADNEWTRTVDNLPVKKDGKDVEYTWVENTNEISADYTLSAYEENGERRWSG